MSWEVINMPIFLDQHDKKLVKQATDIITMAFKKANMPAAVAKRISGVATRYRNIGRSAAIRRHPFRDICEKSGKSLKREDAHLDELEPEKGYAGKLRWVCPKANNSGTKSCGEC